ncbi:hypothetical protein IAD21_05101 [Abditibacteriota bacterium]|nr:hypothetical protein IAD21_05101 [Abditibacteriota bacterium]
MATLNPQIPLEARQTILDQVVAGASFTAYEITLEVRRRLGPTVEVPHSVVNSIVQTMFSNGEMVGYNRAPDTTVRAATPPFRYAPRAASAGITTTPRTVAPGPAFIGVNRANLPISLRYSNPITAAIRAYAVEARLFHDAVGIGNTPFKVWLPTTQTPTFRIRSVGASLSESEVTSRYSLSPGSQSDFGSKAAYAYADEFRVTTYAGGTAKTYRAALDMTLVGTVTKDGEVPTKQEDGVEIELAVKPTDIQRFCDEAALVFAYFRVPPRVQAGLLGAFNRPKPLLKGNGWKITSSSGGLAIVEDVAFSINTFNNFPRNAPSNIELDFARGELSISETGESLLYNDTTRQALTNAFLHLEAESWPQIAERISAESTIWQAKLRYAQFANSLGNYFRNSQQPIEWRGVQLDGDGFVPAQPTEVTLLLTSRPTIGTRLKTQKVSQVIAQPDTVVFFNDLGTRTGSPSRMREYFAAHPGVNRAYILTFLSDAAKERFISDTHFETVPAQLLSSLPKPASVSSHGTRTLNRIPFDPKRHAVQSPRNSLLAAFPELSDVGYVGLEQWVRDSRFDGKHWPDFKRLYKKAEACLWPLQDRHRWNKTETDLPSNSPLPDERHAFLLGVMMGHLDSAGVKRGDDHPFPGGGPNARTIAYMTRRAALLLRFLRWSHGLSSERKGMLAPLVAGSMVRAYCSDIQGTLAYQLDLQNDSLQGRPDLVQRVWHDDQLAVSVLKWAFEWLRSHNEIIESTPRHIQQFVQAGDEEVALALLPDLLESGARWSTGYSHTDLARDIQTFGRRGEALRLFARFPFLKARPQWIWSALDTPEADEPEIVRFATPLVEARAQKGEWEAVEQLAPALRTIFLDALAAAFPQGLSLKQWRAISWADQLESLFPALNQMAMSRDVAQFLWDESFLEAWVRLGGEEKWVEAFAPTIREWAQNEEFGFAADLPPTGQTLFFQELLAVQGDSLWGKLDDLDADILSSFTPALAQIPLSDAFWTFVGGLDAQGSARWLDLIGRERATVAFAGLSAPIIRSLLDPNGSGLESLIEAWLRSNGDQLANNEPLLMLAATNLNEGVRAPALARLRQISLNLRVALRLIESGLPEAQTLARPYFENEGDEWAMRVLALADSPVAATRLYALDLLARFRARWTPELLRSLAQHDDARVQAFVAAQLQRAPEVAANEAVTVFDSAIINSRGRARRAKTGVQRRLTTQSAEEPMQLESLLDAARNGAPRDRAWALQQLVRLRLSGAEVPEIQVRGAVARASS